jgi:hypothetical protein
LIGLPAVLVAVAIGMTAVLVRTYAVAPCGVTATALGSPLTLIGLSAVLVAVLIGVIRPVP